MGKVVFDLEGLNLIEAKCVTSYLSDYSEVLQVNILE
jgi:hypothetical protein